ncbi:hypothetical protein [Pedobacter insulae]|uniref:Uncharacterized protein n=1 Tax=Pedobacter insulae TaxID=414048 RepID=A0A1I3A6J4_9SPHI|nr:hypothetical protein [Pedobacter insulae]SFH45628.1 hypothetical protein SAMN04489864_11340 [Pedobacter insulae]
METQDKTPVKKEKFVDKSVHQTHNGAKPVGYGSSIQNSGNGNRTRPQNHDDQNIERPDNVKETE